MLERDRRAYTIYVAQLERERDSVFTMPWDNENELLDVNVELEASMARLDAIANELRAIPVSDLKKS